MTIWVVFVTIVLVKILFSARVLYQIMKSIFKFYLELLARIETVVFKERNWTYTWKDRSMIRNFYSCVTKNSKKFVTLQSKLMFLKNSWRMFHIHTTNGYNTIFCCCNNFIALSSNNNILQWVIWAHIPQGEQEGMSWPLTFTAVQ